MAGGVVGALPADAVLVHVGPHKSGTTAIQASLHAARDRLPPHGVHLASDERHPRAAITEGTGVPALKGERVAGETTWSDLVRAIESRSSARVVLSSEIFSDTKLERIPAMLDELGGPRVHVVLTIRALTRILPSQWQEHLNNRLTMPYDKWLDELFNQPDGPNARRFWRRHAQDRTLDRWLPVVGPHRVCVVAVSQSRPAQLLHAFETLLGLPEGLLPAPPRSNPSLSMGAAEVLRLVNVEAKRRGWSDERYAEIVRQSLAERLKTRPPAPEDRPLTTPSWALDAAVRRQAEAFGYIRSSGVRVVGDLDALLDEQVESNRRVAHAEGGGDALEAACDLLQGLLRRDAPEGAVDAVSTRRLLQITRDRVIRSVARRR